MRALGLFLAATFLVGCGGGSTLVYGVAPGAGISFDSGYGVTANGQGGWSVTMAGFPDSATGDRFSGSVYVNVGSISSVATCATCDASGIVGQTGGYIDFDAIITAGGLAGFEFVHLGATTADPIYLDARVNGFRSSADIFFASTDTGTIAVAGDNPVGFVSP